MNPSDEAAPPPPPVFEEPWQAAIFALVVALHDRGVFSWTEWNRTLVRVIAASDAAGQGGVPAEDGHRHPQDWVTALEQLLASRDIATGDEVTRTAQAWAAAYRATPHGQPVVLRPGS